MSQIAPARIDGRPAASPAPDPAAERLEMVQRALSCGTPCDACLPELRRMVAKRPALDPPAACPAD